MVHIGIDGCQQFSHLSFDIYVYSLIHIGLHEGPGDVCCSQVFSLHPSEVDSYLDELGDDVANSKRLQEPDQKKARDQLLGSLRREADEGLDVPCFKD